MPSQAEQDRATARRVAVVEVIRDSLRSRKYPPTVAEISAVTGVSHRQTRTDLLVLEAAGVIERDAGVPRGLRLKARR